MSWSYVGTPYSGKEKVRAIIGDTNHDDPFLKDFEILAMLTVFPNEIEASAHLCLSLAARFAIEGDLHVDGYNFKNIEKAEFFKGLSKQLFMQVHGNSSAIPLATASFGGVSVSGKNTNKDNTDNVKPAFYRDQFQGNLVGNDDE